MEGGVGQGRPFLSLRLGGSSGEGLLDVSLKMDSETRLSVLDLNEATEVGGFCL